MNVCCKPWIILWVLTYAHAVFATPDLVDLAPAKRYVTITGFTRAQAVMPLIAEEAGKVVDIFSDVGEAIPQAGQFACLDNTFISIDIEEAKNDINRHYNDIDFFKKEVARHTHLVNKQSASVSLLDNLKRNLENARRAHMEAHIRKKRLEERKLRHCISAHPGWLVIDRFIEPGQWVSIGDKVAEIGDYSKLDIPLSLSAIELASLKAKQDSLAVFFTDYKVKVPAVIHHISPAFDEKSRKILVELMINNNQTVRLQGGVRGELTIDIPYADNTFEIAKSALDERFGEYWLTKADNKRLRVKLISFLNDSTAVIESPDIKLGDHFKLIR